MPWKVRDNVSLRKEFVLLAIQPDANVRELCRRFGISPKTGYKWITLVTPENIRSESGPLANPDYRIAPKP